jgi:hypothetical protein
MRQYGRAICVEASIGRRARSMGNNPRICDLMNRAARPSARPQDGLSCFPRAGAVSLFVSRFEARLSERLAETPRLGPNDGDRAFQ